MHYLGVDVGSLTTKVVVIDEAQEVLFSSYIRNTGGPIEAIQQAFRELYARLGGLLRVARE